MGESQLDADLFNRGKSQERKFTLEYCDQRFYSSRKFDKYPYHWVSLTACGRSAKLTKPSATGGTGASTAQEQVQSRAARDSLVALIPPALHHFFLPRKCEFFSSEDHLRHCDVFRCSKRNKRPFNTLTWCENSHMLPSDVF